MKCYNVNSLKKIIKALFIVIFLFLCTTGMAQNTIVIKGEITNLSLHQIRIADNTPRKKTIQRFVTQNGQFDVTLPIDKPQEINIYPFQYAENTIRDTILNFYYQAPPLVIFVAPGDTISIDGDAMNIWEAKVEGGANAEDYYMLWSQLTPLYSEIHRLKFDEYRLVKDGKREEAKKVDVQQKELSTKIRTLTRDFFTKNTQSVYGIYKFANSLAGLQPVEIEQIYNSYSPKMQQTVFGKKVRDFIQKNKDVGKGTSMIDFAGTTLNGDAFNSEGLRGKYVLLDFWGSWCGPCRASNPHLKELYAKYKTKGFEIVGIAQELMGDSARDRKAWKGAVEADGLPWIQLLNNEMKKTLDLVEAYHVKSFPTKVLIGKDGVIIWKGIGLEDELDVQLGSIFSTLKLRFHQYLARNYFAIES